MVRGNKAARFAAVLALFAAAVYLLRELLAPICWAALIAVSSWPLHQRLVRRLGGRHSASAAALTATVVLLLLAPLALLVVEGLREIPVAIELWATGRDTGLAATDWLSRLPLAGPALLREWQATIGLPGAIADYVHNALGGIDLRTGRLAVLWVAHRLMAVFFCALTLFFLYRHGASVAHQIDRVLFAQLGARGLRTKRLAVDAMRATVNGVTLVGLALAVVMSVAYVVAGVRHPALAGLATGLFGMVPFGATVVLVVVVLTLLGTGAQGAAIGVLAFGGVAIFLTDHFVRPFFIAGPSRLPFVVALLGIVGGLETFGLLGLFIGPTLLAVALTVWRQLAADGSDEAEVRAVS
jgi:predicted PurR-regulated permease PerM